jgi:hypothetical protein
MFASGRKASGHTWIVAWSFMWFWANATRVDAVAFAAALLLLWLAIEFLLRIGK